ncbi:MAG: hypothetical protein C5B43_02310 [Verrucomicrobia bacterium]|nr:MAG: hypothetical protein C5B43_02310 [Verrucomicrobiota bacterium]
MNFYIVTSIAFEDWDYDSSIKKGIGGSETSIVEMSWRLARRGHKVTVYAPITKSTKRDWRGTKWYRFEKATYKEPGVWIIYRVPELIDKFMPRKKNQQLWFLWQDWYYPNLNKKRQKAVDRHITLCKAHGKKILREYPWITKEQLWLSSNGIKVDLLEEIEKEKIKRNPFRIMHASSPDRGLKQAILIFRKAHEYVPDLELHPFYGFNNLYKLIKGNPNTKMAQNVQEIKDLIKNTPGVIFHGRVSQPDLYREWFKSGMYLYITDFFETSNIASQEAQAMGAIPVFSPIYAQKENIQHGIGIEGSSMDPLTIARAAAEIVRLALDHKLQEKLRSEMMQWARKRFDWERFTTQWIMEAEGKRKEFEKQYDFPNQIV